MVTSSVDELGGTCRSSDEMEGEEEESDEMLRGGAPDCCGYTIMKPLLYTLAW